MRKVIICFSMLFMLGSLGLGVETKNHETESTETETEAHTQETEIHTEAETETEVQTETPKVIEVTEIKIAYGEKGRPYDGTAKVKLETKAESLPEGIELLAWGKASDKNVGLWSVKVKCILKGKDAKQYTLKVPELKEKVKIFPKELKVHISDANKEYYTENDVNKLQFTEEVAVTIEGFIKEEERFIPELAIDEHVIYKASPLYESGILKVYKNAVIVKEKKSVNPNYTYQVEYGDISLTAGSISEKEHYTLQTSSGKALFQDDMGKSWLCGEEQLQALPMKDSGYNFALVEQDETCSWKRKITLEWRDESGEVRAASQTAEVECYRDAILPNGEIQIQGLPVETDEVRYLGEKIRVSMEGTVDEQTGVQEILCQINRDSKEGLWQNAAEVLLEKEGQYLVRFQLKDGAGNIKILESPLLILDKTPPKVHSKGVKSQSTGNEDFTLEILLKDENLKSGSLDVNILDEEGESSKWSYSEATNQDGEKRIYQCPPRERKWDHIYTFRISGKDLAGNLVEETIHFTVNRFGSTYLVSMEGENIYYKKEPVPIQISEWNLDYLKKIKIMLSLDGQVRELISEKDYKISVSGSEKEGKKYVYDLPKDLFEKEGMYQLILSSEDEAKNESDNRMSQQQISFVIDKSPPSVVIAGVENQKHYQEQSRQIFVETRDYLGVEKVQVFLDNQVIKEGKEELECRIVGKNGWQKLKVRAWDQAGNVTETEELAVLITQSEQPQLIPTEQKTKLFGFGKKQQAIQEEEAEILPGFASKSSETRKELKMNPAEEEKPWKIGEIFLIITMVATLIISGFIFYKKAKE